MLVLLFAGSGGSEVSVDTDITGPSDLTVYRYGSNYVELAWVSAVRSPTKGVKSYKMYVNGVWDGATINPNYTATSMNSSKLALTPGTAYSFYVTAVDTDNVETLPSNTVNVTTARNVDVGKFKRRRYSVA